MSHLAISKLFQYSSGLIPKHKVSSLSNIWRKGTPVVCSTQRRLCSRLTDSTDKPPYKVLYDGQCPLCVREVNILKKVNSGDLNFIDISVGEYDPNKFEGIKYEEAMGALHVIAPDKKLFVGMEGTRELYRVVGLGWVMAWTELPGIKNLTDSAYAWFAKNRHWLTGREGEVKDCDNGRCKIPQQKK